VNSKNKEMARIKPTIMANVAKGLLAIDFIGDWGERFDQSALR
jgi:hypothetical protein